MSQSYAGPVFATNIQNTSANIANPTGAGAMNADTNGSVLYTAGANGSRVYGVFLSNSGAGANAIFLYIKNVVGGTTYYLNIGNISIPANSGVTAGTAAVDALASANCPGLPFDGTGKPYIELAPNAILKFSTVAALGAAVTVYASAVGADY